MTIRSAGQTKGHTEVTTNESKRMRLFAAVAVICALAAGGAAFTLTGGPTNPLPSPSDITAAGYQQRFAVSGATITAINLNTLSTDGPPITGVSMTSSRGHRPGFGHRRDRLGPHRGDRAASLSSTGFTALAPGLSATCTGSTHGFDRNRERVRRPVYK